LATSKRRQSIYHQAHPLFLKTQRSHISQSAPSAEHPKSKTRTSISCPTCNIQQLNQPTPCKTVPAERIVCKVTTQATAASLTAPAYTARVGVPATSRTSGKTMLLEQILHSSDLQAAMDSTALALPSSLWFGPSLHTPACGPQLRHGTRRANMPTSAWDTPSKFRRL
jgi:hypothetical protein